MNYKVSCCLYKKSDLDALTAIRYVFLKKVVNNRKRNDQQLEDFLNKRRKVHFENEETASPIIVALEILNSKRKHTKGS